MLNISTELRQTANVSRRRWLAPIGTAMAMLTCYGVTAAIGVLSLFSVSVALPFRAPFIMLFSGIAAISLVGSYRQHKNRPAVALGLVGFILIAGSKILPPILNAEALGIEGAGFICMVGGNILAFRARRQVGLSCRVPRAVRT